MENERHFSLRHCGCLAVIGFFATILSSLGSVIFANNCIPSQYPHGCPAFRREFAPLKATRVSQEPCSCNCIRCERNSCWCTKMLWDWGDAASCTEKTSPQIASQLSSSDLNVSKHVWIRKYNVFFARGSKLEGSAGACTSDVDAVDSTSDAELGIALLATASALLVYFAWMVLNVYCFKTSQRSQRRQTQSLI